MIGQLWDLVEKWREHGSPADQSCGDELEAALSAEDHLWYCEPCSNEAGSWIGFETHFESSTQFCPYCGKETVKPVPDFEEMREDGE